MAIGVTAAVHQAVLVTRDERDFAGKKAYTDGTVAVDLDPLSLLCQCSVPQTA